MKLFVLVALATSVTCGAFAQGRRPIHPAGKGVKLGGLGKDYVALTQAYSWADDNPRLKLVTTLALPPGVYRVKFEDDEGYYLPAPGKIGEKAFDSVWTFEGGLYLRKNKANGFWLYEVDRQGKFVPLDRELPRDAVKHFRQ